MGFRERMSQALLKAANRVAPTEYDPKAPGSMNVGSNPPTSDVEQALDRQGMETGGPFAPGRPLDQFFPQGEKPRQWDYTTGYNIATRPRAVESGMSFDTMRELLQSYDVARLCIERREDEIRGLEWSIIPDETVNDKEDLTSQIKMVTDFFMCPDGQTPFDQWQNAFLDDVLSFDAGAIYVRKTRAGKIGALEVVDGTTIAPLIDFWGHAPDPPAPAFSQYVQGIPSVWLTRDELIYNPFRSNARSPYGTPPVEWLVMTMNTDIRWQWSFLQYFTEGTVPDTFMEAPPDFKDAKQIQEFQDLWDATMAGDQAMKHKVKWVPNGAKPIPAKDTSFDTKFPEFLLKKTCAAFKVTPEEIGFTEDSNRASGELQENIMYRASLLPLTKYLAGIYTRIIKKYFGVPLKFHFNVGEKSDKLIEAQTHQIYTQIGAESADEIRKNILGLDPDPNMPVGRFIQTNYGPLPIDQIGKMIPYMWIPSQDAGIYQKRGTPLMPTTSVSVQPPQGPDEPFAQRATQEAQRAVDEANRNDEQVENDGVEKAIAPSDDDVLTELKRWKQNSKRRVKKGRATRQFESDILPDGIHDQVWERLQSATNTEEVDRAFRGPFFW
ncbi:phage portal protein [Sporolactobacillus kofuensis]|uniref:Phage portal protein n=1 Tax=Sporolactobacillus kofuensis TaxID=269672 RepID=A0ABW1WAN2_9BACL|nr:phage portal protein [Sporolactobacillus kofuensis]MCO7177026.1 phage portal protein [Sporolactobacillus kofuensis]